MEKSSQDLQPQHDDESELKKDCWGKPTRTMISVLAHRLATETKQQTHLSGKQKIDSKPEKSTIIAAHRRQKILLKDVQPLLANKPDFKTIVTARKPGLPRNPGCGSLRLESLAKNRFHLSPSTRIRNTKKRADEIEYQSQNRQAINCDSQRRWKSLPKTCSHNVTTNPT